MPSFSNLNDGRGGEILMVTSVQNSDIERMTGRNPTKSFPVLCRLLALLLALAVVTPVLKIGIKLTDGIKSMTRLGRGS